MVGVSNANAVKSISCEDRTTYPIDYRANVVHLIVFLRAVLTVFALMVQIKDEKTT